MVSATIGAGRAGGRVDHDLRRTAYLRTHERRRAGRHLHGDGDLPGVVGHRAGQDARGSADLGQAAGHAGDLEAYVDQVARCGGQPVAALGPRVAEGRLEGQLHRRGLRDPGVAALERLDDGRGAEVVGADDGLGEADGLAVVVGVGVADDRDEASRHQQRVPVLEGGLVVAGPRPVPDLDGVHVGVVVAVVPPDAGQRVERVRRDRHPAQLAHPVGERRQQGVLGPVAPVDPGAGRQPDREPVPAAGGDLLAAHHQEVVGDVPAPDQGGGAGVVVGGAEEVQPGRARRGQHLRLGARAVGVPGVDVHVAAVPARTGPRHPPRRRVGLERRPLRTEVEAHVDPPRGARRHDLVRPEQDVPDPRRDRPGEVARGGGGPADPEVPPRPARPAAEAGRVADAVTRGVEDPDVDDVVAEAQAGVGRVEVVGHLDRADALRHPERQVVPVRGVRVGELAAEGPADDRPRGGRLDGDRLDGEHGRGRRDAGSREQEPASVEA